MARRTYRKARRAELEEETRQRIVDALIHLHGTVGPARTTVAAVAEEAGVQRATVYRHFPDEVAMITACSGKWMHQHPPPDPSAWADVTDPTKRMRTALAEVYAYYASAEDMLTNVFRDATLVDALAPSVQGFGDYLAAATNALAGSARRTVRRAAIAHALSFSTWQSLVRDNGLAAGTAVSLMADWIANATR